MTNITAQRFNDGGKMAYVLQITGHADYDEGGRDIVCAGVSAITYSLLGWLEDHAGRVDIMEQQMDPGDVRLAFRGSADDAYQMAVCGYQLIANSYPANVLVEEIG